MKEPKIAAAYIRVSTSDQLEYSPDSQLKLIREHAKRDGFIIPDEYVFREDDGISGKRADKRPAFRVMIATAKSGKEPPFSTIFVWKFSRFARNQEESIMYKNLLKRRGVDVRSLSEPSSDSPFASLIERIIEWMDEYYLINLATEVRRGMIEKVSRGEPTGKPPYGYTVAEKTLRPNDDAAVVRWVFEQYASGMGMRAIAAELRKSGVTTVQGNPPDNRFVKYMLQNPAYVGKLRYSRNGRAHYSREDYTGEDVMLIDAPHEQIIAPDLWERVQKRLSEKDSEPTYVRRNNPRMYMLKGLVRCSNCGSTLCMTSAKNPGLQCHKYANGQCGISHHIKMDTAEDAVLSYLESALVSDTFTFSPTVSRRTKPAADYDKLMRSEEARLKRAKSAFLDGVFSKEEYVELRDEIQRNIETMRMAQKQAEPQESAPSPAAFRPKIMHVMDILRDPEIPAATKNAALRSVIDKIVFDRRQNTFDIFFCP